MKKLRELKWALRFFFIGITKRLLLFLANVKRKIYSHKELQILFQHYHENYLDKITF